MASAVAIPCADVADVSSAARAPSVTFLNTAEYSFSSSDDVTARELERSMEFARAARAKFAETGVLFSDADFPANNASLGAGAELFTEMPYGDGEDTVETINIPVLWRRPPHLLDDEGWASKSYDASIPADLSRLRRSAARGQADAEFALQTGTLRFAPSAAPPPEDIALVEGMALCKPEPQRRGPEWTFLRDDFSAADVVQGQLGTCWFTSAVSVVATRPHLMERIFRYELQGADGTPRSKRPIPLSPDGLYQVVLCVNGQWRAINVDSTLPVHSLSGGAAFGKARRRQTWVGVLEKAAAKASGGYAALNGGLVTDALRLLTGAPTQSVLLRTNELYEESRDRADAESERASSLRNFIAPAIAALGAAAVAAAATLSGLAVAASRALTKPASPSVLFRTKLSTLGVAAVVAGAAVSAGRSAWIAVASAQRHWVHKYRRLPPPEVVNALWARLLDFSAQGFLMGATSMYSVEQCASADRLDTINVFDAATLDDLIANSARASSLGIATMHAYSILRMHECKERGLRLLQLRNPWGGRRNLGERERQRRQSRKSTGAGSVVREASVIEGAGGDGDSDADSDESLLYTARSSTSVDGDGETAESDAAPDGAGGYPEYSGAWGDASSLWDSAPDLRAALSPGKEHFDGSFWMSLEDFVMSFVAVDVAHVRDFDGISADTAALPANADGSASGGGDATSATSASTARSPVWQTTRVRLPLNTSADNFRVLRLETSSSGPTDAEVLIVRGLPRHPMPSAIPESLSVLTRSASEKPHALMRAVTAGSADAGEGVANDNNFDVLTHCDDALRAPDFAIFEERTDGSGDGGGGDLRMLPGKVDHRRGASFLSVQLPGQRAGRVLHIALFSAPSFRLSADGAPDTAVVAVHSNAPVRVGVEVMPRPWLLRAMRLYAEHLNENEMLVSKRYAGAAPTMLNSPLLFAALLGFTDMCAELIAASPHEVAMKENNDAGVLAAAALGGSPTIVRMLIDAGATPSNTDIIVAIATQKTAAALELIASCAPAKVRGGELLTLAVMELLPAVVTALIRAGVSGIDDAFHACIFFHGSLHVAAPKFPALIATLAALVDGGARDTLFVLEAAEKCGAHMDVRRVVARAPRPKFHFSLQFLASLFRGRVVPPPPHSAIVKLRAAVYFAESVRMEASGSGGGDGGEDEDEDEQRGTVGASRRVVLAGRLFRESIEEATETGALELAKAAESARDAYFR